nr:hypothetical protein [Tanacetum cinerariifolium]
MYKPIIEFVKAADSPTVIKTNKVETARKSPVKYAEMYRNTSKSPKVRGKNWPKNNFAHKNVKPRAGLLKTGRTPITVNRTNMNAAQPKRTSFAKTAHSFVRRPFQRKSAVRTQFRVPRVSIVNKKFPTVDSEFSTAKSTFTAGLRNKGKAVKASACWIWRPKQNTTEKGSASHERFYIRELHHLYYKSEHNINIHQIVYFVEASHIRIETTNEGTKILATVDDEPASLFRDDSQGEAFLTVSGLDAGQDRENIIKTYALPHDSTPRVTSLDTDESNLEISSLKVRIKLLEDKDKGNAEPTRDDAPIKGRIMEIREEVGLERSNNDIEELVNVLTSMDAANILTSGVQAVSVPPVTGVLTVGVPTASGLVPTVSAIFTTASVVTPYSTRPIDISAKEKGKEKMVESDMPKKKKLQEQIDAQVAKEMEEEITRDN